MKRVLDRVAVAIAILFLLSILLGASYLVAVGFVTLMERVREAIDDEQNSSGQLVQTVPEQEYVA